MSAGAVVDLARIGWLTLAFMMLLSRVVFQIAGATWMRAFLAAWQTGFVKRVWGALSLVFAALVGIGGVATWPDLERLDRALLVSLAAVLLVDGLVNVLPAGFETFKTRVQDAWVSRHRGTGREGDTHLFAVGNALLAVGSALVAALVISYRPIETNVIVLAAVLAVAATSALIAATRLSRNMPSRSGS